jgi:hypothetical protein
MMATRVLLLTNLIVWACLGEGIRAVAAEAYTPGQSGGEPSAAFAEPFLTKHCIDCHGEEQPEAGLSLVGLGPVDELNADTWKAVWAQVSLGEMPPDDVDQPEAVDRLRFVDWVIAALQQGLADKGGFREHLDPSKGNFLAHELLFGELPAGIDLLPPASPARLWRLTREEHVTRLNELINTEPAYDPERPGLRTHGDAVPTNHGGELKLYFGTDRILKWQGGTVAYATAVKSLPAILSAARDRGLKNYPDLSTVNSAEATQIMAAAGDLLRYMAYGPLSIANPEQITDDPNSYAFEGDIRGLPTSIVYSTKVMRPLTPVHDLMAEEGVSDASLRAAVDDLFEALTFRPPTPEESQDYLTLVKQSIETLGKEEGGFLGLSAVFLDRDALFRPELVEAGEPDRFGRVMLQDWELALAVNHALRYLRPDAPLRQAVLDGRMKTRDDVRRELERMLADESLRTPRVLQFFRDYFDYDHAGFVCKDTKALAETGVSNQGTAHYQAMFDATASTERLIEEVLRDDRDVLRQLLTTRTVVATNADRVYFGRQRAPDERQASIARADAASKERLESLTAELAAAEDAVDLLEAYLEKHPEDRPQREDELARLEKVVATVAQRLEAAQKKKGPAVNHDVEEAVLQGPRVYARVSRRSFGNGSLKPERTLATAPEGERLGILTHPSWLVSHSDAMDNHAIRRGKWIRERLLGGGIPDVPITVDAMLPDEPESTLRERMRVTREQYCWTCHQKMDPLGLPFEMYNHAGLCRTTERGQPVDTTGEIIDSGDPALDGPVRDALELIERVAGSERVEQVFVRHAFRFWMGRNETLHDRPVLQAAHRAYAESGGSMKALLLSLLTSDAFLYRTRDDASP